MYRDVQKGGAACKRFLRTRVYRRLEAAYRRGGLAGVLEFVGLELARDAFRQLDRHGGTAAGQERAQ